MTSHLACQNYSCLKIFGLSFKNQKTLAIETGIQNSGLAQTEGGVCPLVPVVDGVADLKCWDGKEKISLFVINGVLSIPGIGAIAAEDPVAMAALLLDPARQAWLKQAMLDVFPKRFTAKKRGRAT